MWTLFDNALKTTVCTNSTAVEKVTLHVAAEQFYSSKQMLGVRVTSHFKPSK